MKINFGGTPLGSLLVSLLVAVVTLVALGEVVAAGLFWAHLVLCFLLLASFVVLLASFGALLIDKDKDGNS